MWRTAQSPRNGIEPCAISPLVSISAHQTPRWPRQMRSLLSGSGMMTWSTRGREKIALPGQVATPPKPPDSSSTVPEISIAPGKVRIDRHEGVRRDDRGGQPALHVAGAAADRPCRRATTPPNGSTVQPSPGSTTSICELKCTIGARPAPAVARATTLIARIAVAVARRPFAAHELVSKPWRASRAPTIFGARPVGFARRVDRRETDQVGRQPHQVPGALLDRSSQPVVHPPSQPASPRLGKATVIRLQHLVVIA